MEFESNPVLDKDIKKLDKHEPKLLKRLLDAIQKQPEMGKPLEHCANVFSKRTVHRRLVWQVKRQEGKIIAAFVQEPRRGLRSPEGNEIVEEQGRSLPSP